jgi:hypothetical protein
MALTRRCDDLTNQPAKRVVLVALNAARRDGRDDVEAGDTDAACEAPSCSDTKRQSTAASWIWNWRAADG